VTSVQISLPRPVMVLRLIAGRGTFRLGIQVMSVALVGVWGADTFGRYANALGLCAWLTLATTAPEKAALKALPRTRLLTADVARLVLRLAAGPVLALVAVLVPVAVLAPGSAATSYLAAGTFAAATGLLMTISGLHRLRGRPDLDATAFGAAAVVVLAATATTWLVRWSPQRHLLLVSAGLLVVVACMAAALPRDWIRGPARRALLGRVGRATWLLGVSDLADALGPAVLFLVLAASGQTTDSGPLYLALLTSTMVCQLVFYLLRLAQPATSARLRGAGGGAGRSRALRLLRRAEGFGIGFAAVFTVAVLEPHTRVFVIAGGYPVIGALVAVEVALFVTAMLAGFLLENTNSRILTVTSSSAVAGLAAAIPLAAVLVPLLGAAGGLAVLIASITVKADVMRRLLLRSRPELRIS
jgi:hypothetical protein